MSNYSSHIKNVSDFYNKRTGNGLYGTLAPNNKGGAKSRYVAATFDAALIPFIEGNNFETLLDFGCGTGIFSNQASDHVKQVIGVDISNELIRLAEEAYADKQNISFHHMDGIHIPVSNNSNDIIIAREVLCYVPDEQLPSILEEIYRTLKPGGKFLWLEQVSNNPKWQVHPAAPFLKKRAPLKIKEFAAAAGFTAIDEQKIRIPRFPIVYLAWAGLIPESLIPMSARIEIAWHQVFNQPSKRWWDHMFILGKKV